MGRLFPVAGLSNDGRVMPWMLHAFPFLMSRTADQWDAIGSVVGGAGSIAAVLGAGALLWAQVSVARREARQYAMERREQAMQLQKEVLRQRDEEAHQARLIIAELGQSGPNPDDPDETIEQFIDVTNHSDSMFLDVVVRIPGTELRRLIHYIKPGATESVEFRDLDPDYHVMHISCGGPYTPYQLRASLEFTDASGRRWRRIGWDQPDLLPAQLANSDLYRYLPPTPSEEHPYDTELASLGLAVDQTER